MCKRRRRKAVALVAPQTMKDIEQGQQFVGVGGDDDDTQVFPACAICGSAVQQHDAEEGSCSSVALMTAPGAGLV